MIKHFPRRGCVCSHLAAINNDFAPKTDQRKWHAANLDERFDFFGLRTRDGASDISIYRLSSQEREKAKSLRTMTRPKTKSPHRTDQTAKSIIKSSNEDSVFFSSLKRARE